MEISRHPDRARGRVLTVHPATRKVEVGIRDGGTIEVPIIFTGTVFRWPKEGELWSICRRNHSWYLDSLIEEHDETFPIEGLDSGHTKISSEEVYDLLGRRFATETHYPMTEVAASDVPNNSLFVGASDHQLKFKSHAGVIGTIAFSAILVQPAACAATATMVFPTFNS